MSLSGSELQRLARATAASLADVRGGRPFSPHLEVWKVRDTVFLIITEDDPDQQIITVKADPHHGDALRRDHSAISRGAAAARARRSRAATGAPPPGSS